MNAPIRLSVPPTAAPRELSTPRFLLHAQTLDHNRADYEAVMASQEHLRRWSGSEWPEDTFSLEDNERDLAEHIADAARGEAYGYTVFAPNGERVLGSLYLNPPAWFIGNYVAPADLIRAWAAADVTVDYWLRPAMEADPAAHSAFVRRVNRWLIEQWGWPTPWWSWRDSMSARDPLFDSLRAERIGCFNYIPAPTLRRVLYRCSRAMG